MPPKTFLLFSSIYYTWIFGQNQEPGNPPVTSPVTYTEWMTFVGVSLLALSAIYCVLSLRKALQSLALTRMAETAFQADTPEEAVDRGRTIAVLLGKALPIGVETALQKPVQGRLERGGLPPYVVEARLGLIRTLAEFPDQRNQILADWEACFGDRDSWPLRLREFMPSGTP